VTNVIRHAGPASARVRLAYGEGELVVEVDDDGRGAASNGGGGGGNGLVGMRERAAALGGSVEAGPRAGGGFRVRARLPLEEAP
jgi:signal transduction histidine kinase